MNTYIAILCAVAHLSSVAFGQLDPTQIDAPSIPPNTPWDDVCGVPYETGICKAAITRFYYNVATRECQTFIYGGCGGNYNNFMTVDECKKYCDRSTLLQAPANPQIPPEYQNHDESEHQQTTQNRDFSLPPRSNEDVHTSHFVPTTTENKESSGSKLKSTYWPVFGGLCAGLYSLARSVFQW